MQLDYWKANPPIIPTWIDLWAYGNLRIQWSSLIRLFQELFQQAEIRAPAHTRINIAPVCCQGYLVSRTCDRTSLLHSHLNIEIFPTYRRRPRYHHGTSPSLPMLLEGHETPSAEQLGEEANKHAGPEEFAEPITRNKKSKKDRRSTVGRGRGIGGG